MTKENIESLFPNIASSGFSITSPATSEYNCIAWAATDTGAWWEPDSMDLCYWPSKIPREFTLDAYIKAYESLGYAVCKGGECEEGFEKIAIYVDANNKPTHAARQLSSGSWTSKLGRSEDIEHAAVEGLCGSSYGVVAVFMKRTMPNPPSPRT